MIEFKAECGHTVRAREEDAGDAVRCAYCGRPANVPLSSDGNLDFLTKEIEESVVASRQNERPKKRWFARSPRKKAVAVEGINPFGIIAKLCYAALLIVVVYVVVERVVLPLNEGGAAAKPVSIEPRGEGVKQGGAGAASMSSESTASQGVARSTGRGLLVGRPAAGLYVTSFPTGASVYFMERAKAPERGRLSAAPGVRQITSDGVLPNVGDGEFVVEVSIPWHDKVLQRFPGYIDFRRSIEKSTERERRDLMEAYFVPDEAFDAFVDESDGQFYLVRHYRAEAKRGQLSGVRALLLPRVRGSGRAAFTLEPVVNEYLPNMRRYGFDEEVVRNELAYYGVADPERGFVIEALYRVGVAPAVTSDGRTRVFTIRMQDGDFRMRVAREP